MHVILVAHHWIHTTCLYEPGVVIWCSNTQMHLFLHIAQSAICNLYVYWLFEQLKYRICPLFNYYYIYYYYKVSWCSHFILSDGRKCNSNRRTTIEPTFEHNFFSMVRKRDLEIATRLPFVLFIVMWSFVFVSIYINIQQR